MSERESTIVKYQLRFGSKNPRKVTADADADDDDQGTGGKKGN